MVRIAASFIRKAFHKPVIKNGMSPHHKSKLRNPQFASFMATGSRKAINTDMKDAVLVGRKLVRYILFAFAAAVLIWILMESAHGLSAF
jgi:hypothetical protein